MCDACVRGTSRSVTLTDGQADRPTDDRDDPCVSACICRLCAEICRLSKTDKAWVNKINVIKL